MKRPHSVEGLLTDEQKTFWTEVAENKGLTLEELLRRVVDDAEERERHIQRSFPRARKLIGRPPEGVDGQWKDLAESLKKVYAKLREDYGKDFERVYGDQVRRLDEAIGRKDVEALAEIERGKPWVRKKW